jgi:uncharacterized membrane protein YfcA
VSDVAWLYAAGVLAGVVSVVASLASLVSYPALLAAGLPPLAANVTNTTALVFVGFGSAAGSRPELAGQRSRLWRLALLNAVGGGIGAALLLLTPASAFEAAVPWLIAGASVVLLLGPRLQRGHPGGREDSRPLQGVVVAVAVYTGYFGAAGGVLALAALTALLDLPLPRTIAIKNVVSAVANAVAALAFAVFGPVDWTAVAPLALGFLTGGWIGPSLVRRLPAGPLRIFIALCGLAVAAKLALDTYA